MIRVIDRRRAAALCRRLEGYFFILPALLFMVAMVGYSILYNFYISFTDMDMTTLGGGYSFIGFANYRTIFSDAGFWKIVGQTYVFTVLSLVIQFVAGFFLASLFYKKFAGASFLRSAMLIPFMVPLPVVAMLFKNMWQTGVSDGVINYMLSNLHLMDAAAPVGWLIDPQFAMPAMVLTNCWGGIPFTMLLLLTGFSSISEDVYEAACIDGAIGLRKFFSITLPLLKSAIFSVLTLGFIYTFKVYDIVYIMTMGGPANSTQLLSTYAYQLSFTQFRFAQGSTAAVILFLCVMLVGVFYLFLIRNEEAQ